WDLTEYPYATKALVYSRIKRECPNVATLATRAGGIWREDVHTWDSHEIPPGPDTVCTWCIDSTPHASQMLDCGILAVGALTHGLISFDGVLPLFVAAHRDLIF